MVIETLLAIGISLWLSLTIVAVGVVTYRRQTELGDSEAEDDWRYSPESLNDD